MNKGQPSSKTPIRERPVRVSDIFTLSTLILILANLVPVAGAFYFGWDLTSVLLIYWAESAVVGFYNICKMIAIGGRSAAYQGVFFIVHFGAFMTIHFMFLYEIFISEMDSISSVSMREALLLFSSLWPALAALFISHGVSFFQNFIGRQEYKNRTVTEQMMEPYQRIVVMQLVIIIGAALTMVIGDTTTVLLLAIIAKIAVDVRAHVIQRQPARVVAHSRE